MLGRRKEKLSLHSPVAQCLALGAAIFAIDVVIPLGVAGGVLYTAVVLIAVRLDTRRDILIVAMLCTLLILIGLLFSPLGGELWKVFFNRFLSVLVVWTTTLLSLGLRSRDERVRRSERRFMTLFDLAPDAYYVCDLEGRLIDVNVAAEELVGYKKEELAGKSLLDLKLLSTDQIKSAESRSNPAVLKEEAGPIEYVLTRKDGSGIPIEINSAIIDYGDGKAILNVARDISVRRQAEENFRFVQFAVDHNALPTYWVRADGSIGYVNRAACRYLGYSNDELLEMGIPDIDPDFSWEAWAGHWKDMKEAGSMVYEARHQRKDGTVFPVEIRSDYIEYEGEEYIWAFARDVTERVAAETKSRESEARFGAVFEQSPCAIVIFDAETMLPMEYNAKALELLEYDAREFCQVPLSEHAAVLSLQEIQKCVAHELNGNSITFETRIRTRRGALKDVLVNGGIVDVSGRSALLGIFQDITDQKRAEEQLRLQSTALEAAANAIFITDPDGSVTWANAAFLRQCGYSFEEVRGQNMRLFRSGVQNKAFYQEMWGTISSGHVWSGEVTNRNKKGELYVDQMTITPVVGHDGQILNYVGIKQDMTEYHRLEQEVESRRRQLIQADKMVSLGLLVSGVAHEINNPVHATMMHARSLREVWRSIEPVLDHYYREQGDFEVAGDSFSQNREHIPDKIEAILSNSKRIENIVRELQDFAREQPSDMTMEVHINHVVTSSCALLSNMLEKSTTKFVVDYGEGLPIVRGNSQRIEQVIVNLLQNACQALRSRQDGIFVSTYVDENTGSVCVKVSDEGVGIPPDYIEKVTEPFFTTRRESRGTGLGLSIAENIVIEHAGRLSFVSGPGGGTTVIVALPPESFVEYRHAQIVANDAMPKEEPLNEAVG